MYPEKHISRERLNQRFCVDCKYFCRERVVGHYCAFILSKVNGGPKYLCDTQRSELDLCGPNGKYFALPESTIVHETKEQALSANLADLTKEMNKRSFAEKVTDWIFEDRKFKY